MSPAGIDSHGIIQRYGFYPDVVLRRDQPQVCVVQFHLGSGYIESRLRSRPEEGLCLLQMTFGLFDPLLFDQYQFLGLKEPEIGLLYIQNDFLDYPVAVQLERTAVPFSRLDRISGLSEIIYSLAQLKRRGVAFSYAFSESAAGLMAFAVSRSLRSIAGKKTKLPVPRARRLRRYGCGSFDRRLILQRDLNAIRKGQLGAGLENAWNEGKRKQQCSPEHES